MAARRAAILNMLRDAALVPDLMTAQLVLLGYLIFHLIILMLLLQAAEAGAVVRRYKVEGSRSRGRRAVALSPLETWTNFAKTGDPRAEVSRGGSRD